MGKKSKKGASDWLDTGDDDAPASIPAATTAAPADDDQDEYDILNPAPSKSKKSKKQKQKPAMFDPDDVQPDLDTADAPDQEECEPVYLNLCSICSACAIPQHFRHPRPSFVTSAILYLSLIYTR
jgi:hypothetical protein